MRDNHPRKRQASKREHKLERAKDTRKGFPLILIVCEGAETEPNYLRGLCEAHRINRVNVHIKPGGGATDAQSLVKKAMQLFKAKPYDKVFVVLDDDGQRLEVARRLASKRLKTAGDDRIQVEIITSNQSFEFWLLLHFEYTTRAFTSAEEVIEVLRGQLTNYNKSDPLIFSQVATCLDRAMINADRLKREEAQDDGAYPGSDMHLLVNELLALRDQQALRT